MYSRFDIYVPDFLLLEGKDVGFETLSDEDLTSRLREFYCCVRTKNGEEYGRSAYRNVRSGLQRYFQSLPWNRTLDLRNDKVFQRANQVYEGNLKEMKRSGKDVTKHKMAIDETDMKKFYESGTLSNKDPVSLQRKVFLELALHFGRRG
jgi:hypothetical protein